MSTTQDTQNRARKELTQIFGARIPIAVASAGIIVALVFGLLAMWPKTIELTAQVLSGDELTLPLKVRGLVGHYTYGGTEVAHLWKIRVNFVNTGDRTLVGVGPSCNVLYGALHFEFPSETRILDTETDLDQLGAVVTVYEENKLKIEFEQWRKRENLIASFFVSSEALLEQPPLLRATERQIIDGEVRVETLTGQELPRRSYLDVLPLPRPLEVTTRLVGLVFAAFMIFLGGWFFIAPYGYIRWVRWRARYLKQFEEYVTSSSEIPKHMKEFYIKYPGRLGKEHWSKFEGKRAPDDPITHAPWSTVGMSGAGLVIICFFALLVTDLLPL